MISWWEPLVSGVVKGFPGHSKLSASRPSEVAVLTDSAAWTRTSVQVARQSPPPPSHQSMRRSAGLSRASEAPATVVGNNWGGGHATVPLEKAGGIPVGRAKAGPAAFSQETGSFAGCRNQRRSARFHHSRAFRLQATKEGCVTLAPSSARTAKPRRGVVQQSRTLLALTCGAAPSHFGVASVQALRRRRVRVSLVRLSPRTKFVLNAEPFRGDLRLQSEAKLAASWHHERLETIRPLRALTPSDTCQL